MIFFLQKFCSFLVEEDEMEVQITNWQDRKDNISKKLIWIVAIEKSS